MTQTTREALIEKLRNMTTDRGCTPAEAATAKKHLDRLLGSAAREDADERANARARAAAWLREVAAAHERIRARTKAEERARAAAEPQPVRRPRFWGLQSETLTLIDPNEPLPAALPQ